MRPAHASSTNFRNRDIAPLGHAFRQGPRHTALVGKGVWRQGLAVHAVVGPFVDPDSVRKLFFVLRRPGDREEAIAEAAAAELLTLHQANRNGKAHRITPGTLATYAVKHVRAGRHVGGRRDRAKDVFSSRAQRWGGFRVHGLKANGWPMYDCMTASDERVWRDHLLCDRRTPPPDQAAFRVDWSAFLAQQTDRTRIALAMLAAGHQQVDVADRLGITASAICQSVK